MKILRLLTLIGALIIGTDIQSSGQGFQSILQKLTGKSTSTTTKGTPTTLEIGSALKQALEQGTTKSTDQLSALNGFFGNAAVKILFPPEAQKVERTLRSLGLNQLCDNVILSLNRAAEDAAGQAKPIFIDAVKQMTLQDVTNILLGSNDAATQYFKRTTTTALADKFRPVIQASLTKVGATKYYNEVASTYNKVPFVSKVNPDISDYVTQKAISGLFIQIAAEEINIRQNLGARTTPLLQKVFAFADKNKK
ncbi:DUF4197 domain-containing protein [Mucilaginibacter paludis]|uniref:DUF4197 domain-containing protein n=1 Tax=Mucilaginibacter paludis DSM 18603 TaxID=714943 RepID=H1YEI0_9SPHI|nr:DUF4197 domain-containing protein [Mucilaginibacter paludis]EHQ27214.1 hypothetical protein Mucpa_3110 [Mucilaginibacter paludis DSM 18603]